MFTQGPALFLYNGAFYPPSPATYHSNYSVQSLRRNKKMVHPRFAVPHPSSPDHRRPFRSLHTPKPVEHIRSRRPKVMDIHGACVADYVHLHIYHLTSFHASALTACRHRTARSAGPMLPAALSKSRVDLASPHALTLQDAYYRAAERNHL